MAGKWDGWGDNWLLFDLNHIPPEQRWVRLVHQHLDQCLHRVDIQEIDVASTNGAAGEESCNCTDSKPASLMCMELTFSFNRTRKNKKLTRTWKPLSDCRFLWECCWLLASPCSKYRLGIPRSWDPHPENSFYTHPPNGWDRRLPLRPPRPRSLLREHWPHTTEGDLWWRASS